MCQQKLHVIAGKYCETNFDACVADPCLHGGTCIDGIHDYTCECLIGYFGDTCSHHVCDNDQSPCMNGGECYARGGKTLCLCPAGFSGDACERDNCHDVTCLNQGTCDDGSCVCRPGFLGALCSVDICVVRGCLNGGSCDAGECQCAPGYSGYICYMQVSDPGVHTYIGLGEIRRFMFSVKM